MLNTIALEKTDNEVAKEVQEKPYKLFQTIFSHRTCKFLHKYCLKVFNYYPMTSR